ncbi:MAG TPA: hypothetical protein VGS22_23045 [Thermoanaerobaculia bacterium]|nr:hypothetical protein [Thermoanaerobaculia bacterium]
MRARHVGAWGAPGDSAAGRNALKISSSVSAVVLAFAVLAGALPSAGQIGPSHLELFSGQFAPDDPASHTVFGVRVGNRFGHRFGFEVSLGRLDFDGGSVLLADLSFKLYLHPEGPVQGFLFAGPGRVNPENSNGFDEGGVPYNSSASAHVGIGFEIPLRERVYLRPDARMRWYRDVSGADLEASLAVGFRFGG